ncbi:MAG: hypothetical protein AAB906_01045, partial [Patescibacteria group bacterium]
MRQIYLGSHKKLQEYSKRFGELYQKAVRRNVYKYLSEGSIGDNLLQCKNCYWAFVNLSESENLRYTNSTDKARDSMDVFGGTNFELCYDSSAALNCNQVRFSKMIRAGLEVEYSAECSNCEYLFGCFGLRNKKYCIFNKQYKPEDYWMRVDEIKTAMLARREYGEFFSVKDSPHPYNDSNAAIEFPLTKEEVLRRGWYWREEDKPAELSGPDILQAKDVPDNIADVSDDILNKTI